MKWFKKLWSNPWLRYCLECDALLIAAIGVIVLSAVLMVRCQPNPDCMEILGFWTFR